MYKNYDLIGNFLFISMFSQGVDTAQTFLIHWGLNDFKEGGGGIFWKVRPPVPAFNYAHLFDYLLAEGVRTRDR